MYECTRPILESAGDTLLLGWKYSGSMGSTVLVVSCGVATLAEVSRFGAVRHAQGPVDITQRLIVVQN